MRHTQAIGEADPTRTTSSSFFGDFRTNSRSALGEKASDLRLCPSLALGSDGQHLGQVATQAQLAGAIADFARQGDRAFVEPDRCVVFSSDRIQRRKTAQGLEFLGGLRLAAGPFEALFE